MIIYLESTDKLFLRLEIFSPPKLADLFFPSGFIVSAIQKFAFFYVHFQFFARFFKTEMKIRKNHQRTKKEVKKENKDSVIMIN